MARTLKDNQGPSPKTRTSRKKLPETDNFPFSGEPSGFLGFGPEISTADSGNMGFSDLGLIGTGWASDSGPNENTSINQ